MDATQPATETPAQLVADRVWMSEGLSNSYCIDTGDGRVIVNTGMGFEGGFHRRNFDAVAPASTRAIILTQGHYDHVGGVDQFLERDGSTEVIAQANWRTWRDDNERLEQFRVSKSAFAFIGKVMAAIERATAAGLPVAQSKPNPTRTVEDRLDVTIGDREIQLIATPGGETTDSLVIWLANERTLFSGNLFGPLFGHVPNLVTIRGDRYRDPLEYIRSIELVRALAPERLITGHFQPVLGADRIAEEITAMRDAMQHVHDAVVEGMNAGHDVHTLMRDIEVPPELDVGEGYGRTSWNVRAVWELYSGWFHHGSTTELYGVPRSAVAPDIVAAAGARTLADAAYARLTAGEAVAALHLTDIVLAAEPDNVVAQRVAIAAHEQLLVHSQNFWESAWLRRAIAKLDGSA